MRVGEVGQEVLGERCRYTNQTPRTSAPSQNVLEPSGANKETVGGEHVPWSAAKSGFFIPAALTGTAAAVRSRRKAEGRPGRRDGGGEGFGKMAG